MALFYINAIEKINAETDFQQFQQQDKPEN